MSLPKIILIATLVWFLGLGLTHPVAAQLEAPETDPQQSLGLSILPAIIDQPVSPGASTEVSVSVTNIANQALAVDVGARSMAEISESVSEQVRFRYDASKWISTESNFILLDVDETREIVITISPPADAGAGGHYAEIYFRAIGNSTTSGGSSTQIYPEVVATVLLTIPGEIIESLEASLEPIPILSLNPLRTFRLLVTNTGNTHVLTQNLLEFRDFGNKIVEVTPIENKLILPGTTVEFSTDWQAQNFGAYQANYKTSYGSPIRQISSSSNTYYVLPALWLQGLIILLLISVILLIKRLIVKKRGSKRQLGKDDVGPMPNYSPPHHVFDNLKRDRVTSDSAKKKHTK